jgi:circadian clock protein KaiB
MRGVEARPGKIVLRLYVAGEAPNSVMARANLQRCVAGRPEYEIDVVDILSAPERALKDGVLVTPTLIRLDRTPARRIIGDLRSTDVLMAFLAREGGL